MAPPAKKRKVNSDTKPSPNPTRSLDFFFGKQRQNTATQNAGSVAPKAHGNGGSSELTDEELARKLQADWDQEDAADRERADAQNGDKQMVSKDPIEHSKLSKDSLVQDFADETAATGDQQVIADYKPGQHSLDPKSKNTLTLQSAGSAEDTLSSNVPFDESPLAFDPSKYVGDLKDQWAAEGGNASYALLTRCFVLVNGTQSRIKIVDTLVNFLRVIIEGDPSSLLPAVRLHVLPFFVFH